MNRSSGLRKALESERGLSKSAKKELTKLQAAEEARKKEALSELDRTKLERDEAKTRLTTLEQQLETTRIESSVLFEAAKLRFVDPQDAIKMINRKDITIDAETGEVSGVAEALKALVKAKPYLVANGEEGDDKNKSKGKGIGNNTNKGPKGKEEEKPNAQEALAKSQVVL